MQADKNNARNLLYINQRKISLNIQGAYNIKKEDFIGLYDALTRVGWSYLEQFTTWF